MNFKHDEKYQLDKCFPDNWTLRKLNDLEVLVTDRIKINKVSLENYVSTENMLPNKSGIEKAVKIPQYGSVTSFKKGDILLSNIRPYFKKIWLAEFNGGCSNDVLTIRARNYINNYFLYYCLQQDQFFDYVTSNSKGTKMPRGDKDAIFSFELSLPPIIEQKTIAKILSDLDSKIELNQKMNSTLESIAQAIFKHWFIDFEFPNEEGKPYRLSGGDMVDSELGEIPKGWEVIKTGDVINVIRGVSYRSDQLKYSKEALVTLKSVIRGGGFTKNGFKSYLGAYKNNQVLHSNDVIVAFTDLTQLAEVIGRPALIKETSEYKTIVASMDIGIIRPQEYFPYKFFIYHLMRSEAFHSHVLGYVNGTTVLHLSNEGPKSFKFPCPYINSIVTFENFASQLYERVQNNSNQIEYLTSLRDLILPKLISGKIRVPMEE